jgi:tRNA(fMet)-specific endonuclease VapC
VIYLLDTNVCIRYLNGQAPGVLQRMKQTPDHAIAVCAVTHFELLYGGYRSSHSTRTLAAQQQFLGRFRSLPFDDQAAAIAARIRADLAAKGTPIGHYDLLIAAIALAHGLTLVTHNTREFGRVAGLPLEDWEAGP